MSDQLTMTVVIRDVSSFIALGEPVTYRSVRIKLTPEQCEALAMRHDQEEISQTFLEIEEKNTKTEATERLGKHLDIAEQERDEARLALNDLLNAIDECVPEPPDSLRVAIRSARRVEDETPVFDAVCRQRNEAIEALETALNDMVEPGEFIGAMPCPCCGAALDITYGDDPGEIAVVATPVQPTDGEDV